MNRLDTSSLLPSLHGHAPHPGLYGREVRHPTHPAEHGHPGAAAALLFASMGKAFRPSGGIARGEDLAHCMAVHRHGDYASLARQIVERDVLCFEWSASYWLPMFQFDLPELSLRRELLPVIWELHNDCDGWELCAWFARANAALGGQAPVDLLATDLPAVLAAAHADRRVDSD